METMEELPPGFLSLGRGGAAAFAFPTARPPPPLLDEIVESILLRTPPSDPALLLRAAAVCKRWAGLVADPSFRRRYVERHGPAPPLLGFLANLNDAAGSARFFPAGAFRPALAADLTLHGYRAHDARDGRVLLNRIGPPPGGRAAAFAALGVWDPVTAERWPLPLLPRPQHVRSWNAAVLGARPGPFRVGFVGVDAKEVFASVYSSDSAAWTDAGSALLPHDRLDESLRGARAGDALYFVLAKGTGAVQLDLGSRTLSVIPLPKSPFRGRIALMAMEDGGLGFAEVEAQAQCTLRLWARESGPGENAGRWVVTRAIELGKQLPAHVYYVFSVAASADAAGVVFLRTNDGLYTFDLKSGKAVRAMSNHYDDIVPYEGFYTPVLRAPLTDEGPDAGASTA